MHAVLLTLHNTGRYAVLALALWALWRAVSGLLARGGWLPSDERARRLFPIAMDIQVLLGLVLFAFLPPLGEAIRIPEVRFYAMEHSTMGLVAIALAHIGSVKVRKLKVPREKFRTMAIFYGLALVAVLSRMPWDRWLPLR